MRRMLCCGRRPGVKCKYSRFCLGVGCDVSFSLVMGCRSVGVVFGLIP